MLINCKICNGLLPMDARVCDYCFTPDPFDKCHKSVSFWAMSLFVAINFSIYLFVCYQLEIHDYLF